MLLKSYQKEIFRPGCNPSFQSLHCIARLDQDISEALPYLNAELGGFEYLDDPPVVVLKIHGKLIAVHGRKIAINALRDEDEAEKILGWLQREINRAWKNRAAITPCRRGAPKPKIIEILKRLPRTNCRQCGEATCMVFAARLAEGARPPSACPELKQNEREWLADYLNAFAQALQLNEGEIDIRRAHRVPF